jgi:hypothetical protein
VEGDGKTGYVYTVNPDQTSVKKNPVRVAFLTKDKVAVSGGLDDVGQVITDGAGYLTARSVVKVVPNETPSK